VSKVLNTDNPSGIHPELIAISPMARGGQERKYRVSNLGMAGIAVTIVLLSAALLWYIIFSTKGRHMLRKSDETNSTHRANSKGGTSTATGGSSGSWPLRRPGGRNKRRVGMEILDKKISGVSGDEEKTAFKPTRTTESVNFGTSAMLLLKDGRPAEIEFHPVESIERTMSRQPLPSNSPSRSAGLV
jgi:hypothetical protein